LSSGAAAAVIVLTGLGDRQIALAAMQNGAQDYLVKGEFGADLLHRCISYGVERARIRYSERQLLEETLHGSIQALTAVLALANPTAFGRSMRLKQYVTEVAERLGLEERWHIEVAAMVSQVGCVNLSPRVCERLYSGAELSAEEQTLVDRLPGMACDLLRSIPRLEPVRELLSHVRRRCEGPSVPRAADQALPPDAQVLLLALDFDFLEARWGSTEALRRLGGERFTYDAQVFRAFLECRLASERSGAGNALAVSRLVEGMVLSRDVVTSDGRLLIARGLEITEPLLYRLRSYAERGEVQEPIHVLAPPTRPSVAPPVHSLSRSL
jgi:response regulator RpfG family c-di-GMP phosphodiesterase